MTSRLLPSIASITALLALPVTPRAVVDESASRQSALTQIEAAKEVPTLERTATVVVPPQELAPGSTPVGTLDAKRAEDEAAIRKLIADHNAAFDRHDGSANLYFTDDADTRNIVGEFFTGKAEIEKLNVVLNKHWSNVRRTETIKRIRFLTPDIALVDSSGESTGYILTESGAKLPPPKGGMSFKVVVKKEGRWLIAAMRNAVSTRLAPTGSLPGTGIPQAQTSSAHADNNPFVGTWKLNLAKSKIVGPDGTRPFPLTNSVVIYEAVGDQLKIDDDDTFIDGHSIHMEWMGKFDGDDYMVTGDPMADTWSYNKLDDHTLILTTKKNSKIVATRHMTVSADGKTRTNTGGRTDANGKITSITAVYEKQ